MKNRIKIVIVIFAAAAASATATRADEIEDLVAVVAGTMSPNHTEKDAKSTIFGAGKPRYIPKKEKTHISTDLLEGIYKSMKRERFHQMLGNGRDNSYSYSSDTFLDQNTTRPTLGRPDFFRPVPGYITSNFGWRPKFQRMHHGVDLSLQLGDTVRAALSGTVERIAYDHDGYGHYVVISHSDGMETLYGHLQYPLVSQGQYIYSGQPVGIGGNTGNSTGPHLHFEARIGGTAVDPTLLFDFYGNHNFIAEETITNTVPKDPLYSHQKKSLARVSTYIVRYGDTLQSIARQAGISVMRLCQLNMLQQGDKPPIGRMLKLK